MKKLFLFLVLLLTAGCATAGPQQSADLGVHQLADQFLSALQEHRYDYAHSLFSPGFQQELSTHQLEGLMGIVSEQLGPMKDYQSVNMPLLAMSPMEEKMIKREPSKNAARLIYELHFRKQSLLAKVVVIQQHGENKVGVFEFVDVPFSNNPEVQKRIQALGL